MYASGQGKVCLRNMGYIIHISTSVCSCLQNDINSSTNAHKEWKEGKDIFNRLSPNLVLLVASHQPKHDAGALMPRALLHSPAQMYVVKSLVLRLKYPKEWRAFLRNRSINM